MLSRIKEERLPVIAAPVDSRAFSDELNSARSHVLDLISRHLTEFGDKFPAETCQNGFYPPSISTSASMPPCIYSAIGDALRWQRGGLFPCRLYV